MSALDLSKSKVLSHKEKSRFLREIKALKGLLRGEIQVPTNRRIREQVPYRRMKSYGQFMDRAVKEDQRRLTFEIRKRESLLRKGSPEFTKSQKMRLEAQARKDRAWLRRHMNNQRMNNLKHKPGDSEFELAVKVAGFSHTPEYQGVATRYKNTMRIISDDPADANLENIRPKS